MGGEAGGRGGGAGPTVTLGGPSRDPPHPPCSGAPAATDSLFARLGGEPPIMAVSSGLFDACVRGGGRGPEARGARGSVPPPTRLARSPPQAPGRPDAGPLFRQGHDRQAQGCEGGGGWVPGVETPPPKTAAPTPNPGANPRPQVVVGKFLVAALGGPNEYTGRSMVDAHVGVVGLRYPEDFATVAGHLAAVLTELGVGGALHADVLAVAASLAPDFEKVANFRKMIEADA